MIGRNARVFLGLTVLASSAFLGCQDSGFVSGPPAGNIARIVASPPSTTIGKVGASTQLSATAFDSAGNPVDAPKSWTSLNTGTATVDQSGKVISQGLGVALIVVASAGHADTSQVTVQNTPPPPVASDGEFVRFPSEEIAFVIGPQLKSGSSANPWPFFDTNAIETGLRHGASYTSNAADHNYYDQARVQYTNYYRTGDERFLQYARTIADLWYDDFAEAQGVNIAPRVVSLSGLILRALDGRPEMWDWILEWTDFNMRIWLDTRLASETLHYGLRDGGYALYYGALVAATHPDTAVRAEYRERILAVSRDYYARLQYDNGGWYWLDSAAGVRIQKPDGSYYLHSQPFMVGLMLEGLVATHQLTGDPVVAEAILRGAEWLYKYGYRADEPTPLDEVRWRGNWYFVFEPDTPLPSAGGYPVGSEPRFGADGLTVVQGTTLLRDGWDTNSIRDVRQLNPTNIHVFGYAYKISGDSRFLAWGDDMFSASFGNGQGPGTDPYYCLADYIAKNYNQAYRSSGSYLARRAGA